MWKNLNFSIKVSVLVVVFLLFSLITALGYHYMTNQVRTMGLENAKETMLAAYKDEVKDITDVMVASLASATKRATTEKERYEIYSKIAKTPRYFGDRSGYFFVIKKGGYMLMHGANNKLEGRNLWDLQDKAEGEKKYLIRNLEKAALSGGGFSEYVWDKPGKGLVPKLSYSKQIPGTDYYLGTGVYIDDIEEQEAKINATINDFSDNFLTKLYSVLAAIFLLLILPLTIFMVKSMVTPLKNLTETAANYSRGNISDDLLDVDRKDEIGELGRAVKRLGRSTKIVMDRLKHST